MQIAEYLVRCPVCCSEIHLMAHEANPIIFQCRGCSRSIVIQNGGVFTVSNNYLKKIVRQYKSRTCGKIVGTKISDVAKDFINEEKIQQLHDMLAKREDVGDFLKKLGQDTV